MPDYVYMHWNNDWFSQGKTVSALGPLLLTWINLDPSINKQSPAW